MTFFISLALLLFSAEAFCAKTLLVGEKLEVLAALGALTIENGHVLRAKKINQFYEIRAVSPGQSHYSIGGKQDELVIVHSAEFHKTADRFKNHLRQSLSFHLSESGGQIAVGGKLVRFDDWLKLAAVCAETNCRYQADFEIPLEIRAQIRRHLSDHFLARGLGSLQLAPGQPLRVIASESDDNVAREAAHFGLSVQVQKSNLTLAPSVKVQIVIAEVKKNEVHKLGIDWPSQYQAQILPSDGKNLNPLQVSAQFLESRGIGKVLASPNLLCRSGKEAEFLAGGEIPVKVMNFRSQSVIWKKYGILLKIQPQADFSGRMSLGLTTEISSLDPSHSVDGVPGFYSNRVQSHFDLEEPQTIALSGLIKSEESTATSGLPFLSRIPILGKLFSSEDFRRSKTELIIFVRPEVLAIREGAEK